MSTTQKIMEQLTGSHTVRALVTVMEKNFEDFAQDRQRYLAAMDTLREALGDAVEDEMAAIERQTASDLLFSGLLGLKSNLDRFTDPVAKSFLDVDAEVYLQEETAHRLPEYAQAQAVRNRFYKLLSPAQQTLYEDVITYTSHLETVGPKLAHYYGYLVGNALFSQVVPGYHPDTAQTALYTAWIQDYFGKSFV